jgi:outer membrane protein
MKKTILILIGLMFILGCQSLFAQVQLKIGHVNVVEIVSLLPESDSAQLLLEKDTKEFENMLEEMQVELNNLVNDYETNQGNYSDLIRKTKESEIMGMREKIFNFQQNANQQLQQRNYELLQPIYEKVQKAIDNVATRGGFTYILDISKGSVVFTSPDSQNINALVLDELGVER